MFVQYKPKGEPEQSWEFVPDDVFEDDAELVEKHFGDDWDEFLKGVRAGKARARKVLLWHLMRQTHPKLRFDDVPRFRMGEVTAEFSSTELRELAAKLELTDRTNLDDERLAELDAIARGLQTELTDALLREHGNAEAVEAAQVALEVEPTGKAD